MCQVLAYSLGTDCTCKQNKNPSWGLELCIKMQMCIPVYIVSLPSGIYCKEVREGP